MADQEEQIRQVERDRRRREAELVLLLAYLADDARKHARSAVKLGVAPLVAINQVLLGASHVDQPGGAVAVAMALEDAYTAGVKRAFRWAGVKYELQTPPVTAQAYYAQRANFVIQSLATQVNAKVFDSVFNVAGQGVSAATKSINAAFVDGGFTHASDSYLVLAAEQAIVAAYNEGLLAAYLSPGVKNDLRGFIHVSILDDRTTRICEDRPNFTRSWSDPYWLSNWPPLHFRCRSCVFPIFKMQWTGDFGNYPTIPPMDGFGNAPPFITQLLGAA